MDIFSINFGNNATLEIPPPGVLECEFVKIGCDFIYFKNKKKTRQCSGILGGKCL